MDLEHHQLELRYEKLRVRREGKERQILSSLAANGQQVPIVVVAGGAGDQYIVIDGYKRLHALKRLGQDTVKATVWQMNEVDALLLCRSLRATEAESALEQGWLLHLLQSSFGLGQEEMAKRFSRSPSWVSRRLALVHELPDSVQDEVRRGRIGSHAAMKYLVPMARAKVEDCSQLALAIAPLGLSTREVGELYRAWRDSGLTVRQRVLTEPKLFVKARREIKQASPSAADLLRDLDLAGVLVRRVSRQFAECQPDQKEVEQLGSCLSQVTRDLERLGRQIAREEHDAEARATSSHTGALPSKSGHPQDRQDTDDLEADREESNRLGLSHSAGDPPPGESSAIPAGDPGPSCNLQGQPAAGARGVASHGGRSVISSPDSLLSSQRDRHETSQGEWGISLHAGGRDPARHLAASPDPGGQATSGADRLGGPVLLAHALLPVLSDL